MLYCAPYSEQLDDGPQLALFALGRSIPRVRGTLEIPLFDHVAKRIAAAVLLDPRVDQIPKLRTLFAERHRQLTAGPHGDIAVHRDVLEHRAPEFGQIVVHDCDRCEAGVHHLEHVIVFEDIGSDRDRDRRLAARLQLRVQGRETVVVDAPLADEHLLAGQIVNSLDRRRSWPGDDDFVDAAARRHREGDEFFPLGGHGHHGRDHVHRAARESGVELLARHRQDDHVDLEVAGLQVRVEIVLEQLQRLVRQSALLPLVDEVVRAVERHGYADRAALDHLVEVAGERLLQHLPHLFRKRVVGRGCWRERRLVRCRCRGWCRLLGLLRTRAGRRGDDSQHSGQARHMCDFHVSSAPASVYRHSDRKGGYCVRLAGDPQSRGRMAER